MNFGHCQVSDECHIFLGLVMAPIEEPYNFLISSIDTPVALAMSSSDIPADFKLRTIIRRSSSRPSLSPS